MKNNYNFKEIENYIVDRELGFIDENLEIEKIIKTSPKYQHILNTHKMLSSAMSKEESFDIEKKGFVESLIKTWDKFWENSWKFTLSPAIAFVIMAVLIIKPAKIYLDKSSFKNSNIKVEQAGEIIKINSDKKFDMEEDISLVKKELRKDLKTEEKENLILAPKKKMARKRMKINEEKSAGRAIPSKKSIEIPSMSVSSYKMDDSIAGEELNGINFNADISDVKINFVEGIKDKGIYKKSVSIKLNKEVGKTYKIFMNNKSYKEEREFKEIGKHKLLIKIYKGKKLLKEINIEFEIIN